MSLEFVFILKMVFVIAISMIGICFSHSRKPDENETAEDLENEKT
jgi:hypothetical protein